MRKTTQNVVPLSVFTWIPGDRELIIEHSDITAHMNISRDVWPTFIEVRSHHTGRHVLFKFAKGTYSPWSSSGEMPELLFQKYVPVADTLDVRDLTLTVLND